MIHAQLVWLFLLFTCVACKAQKKEKSFGVVLFPADKIISKNIHLVKAGNTTSVIFPAAYGKKQFGRLHPGMVFFTPDTNLVKRINNEIIYQYCKANERFLTNFWQNNLKVSKGDTINLNKSIEVSKLESSKYCDLWQVNSAFYDKQFVGYFSKKGEKILLIKLIDFRQDPYKLKSNLAITWIDGWHGWFYSNIIQLHYHVDKDLLTIDEDI